MNRLKLIFRIIIHLALMVTAQGCNLLSKGFGLANTGLDKLLELNETHTDGLIGE